MIQTTSSSAKRTRVSWKRVLLLLALVLIGIWSVEWFLEPWYFARIISRDNPALNVRPERLTFTESAKLAPERLNVFRYSLQTPWKQIARRKDSQTVSIISFSGGPTVMAFDPGQLTSLSSTVLTSAKRLQPVFGSRAVSSAYNWMEAELNATPDDIRWWNRRGNVRAAVLLGLKQVDILDDPAIFKVGNDEMHGFQLGDPAKPPYRARLELFDIDDRRYEIEISSISPGVIPVTQADVNAIVASLRPIPHN